ncbi:hypothetical protein I6N90_13250 [Paenibacillus sp. GSMTC-2017]|uniref:imm11 family protein n=1 Tax=Paenibacillus sp. GSMTC-2017 TaxID=2794350 RepID=UPI0018D654D0|nr:DUF1629 domain-containing protein [Paenibacillus sp. GSMTC-2017]MBH5318767.1 hypothetical protein [Paenibacillus sp. GSMTC-2017]
MKVWWLDYHPSFNTTEFVEIESYFELRKYFSQAMPLSNQWVQHEVKLVEKGKPADFLKELGGALIASRRARDAIEQMPNLNIEFLPLTSTDGEFSILNVLTVLDCVDHTKSKESRIGDSLKDYEELALIEDKVKGHNMFKIKLHEGERILPQIFVSDKIKELIESQLEGYQLVECWDSEFSWQQKEAVYHSMCEEVDKSLKTTFTFEKALKYAQKNSGKTVYSGKWALKSDSNKDIWIGHLLLDGTYSWLIPVYYAPILLELTWGIKEKKKFIAFLR